MAPTGPPSLRPWLQMVYEISCTTPTPTQQHILLILVLPEKGLSRVVKFFFSFW
jgi:phage terminase large subunit-like protein